LQPSGRDRNPRRVYLGGQDLRQSVLPVLTLQKQFAAQMAGRRLVAASNSGFNFAAQLLGLARLVAEQV